MKAAVQLVIPTLNAGPLWLEVIQAIQAQKGLAFEVLVIDSGSVDQTVQWAKEAVWPVKRIEASSFNHGGTRQWAVEQQAPKTHFVVFMTQDAILGNDHALKYLLEPFEDPSIAGVYGRQLPHLNASLYAASTRWIHYPDQSETRSFADTQRLGLKTVFFSNSFAAYRVDALKAVGGFPKSVPLGEDMYVCAKFLASGFKVRYCAQACVRHSHNFTYKEEFLRYKATGGFHAQEKWLLKTFGTTSKLGHETLRLQIKRYNKHNRAPSFWKIFLYADLFLRSTIKFMGYWMGRVFG